MCVSRFEESPCTHSLCLWQRQATGFRVAVARTSGNVAPAPFRAPFPVLPDEKAINLRVLVDRSIVVRCHMTCTLDATTANGLHVNVNNVLVLGCSRSLCWRTAALRSPRAAILPLRKRACSS